jgi:hypothetical protein
MRFRSISCALGLAAVASASAAHAICGNPGDPNLVINCGLNANNVTNYTAIQGSCVHSAAAGAALVGSMVCDAASDGFMPPGFRFVVKQCMTGVTASTKYQVAVSARYASGPNTATCTVAGGEGADCGSASVSAVSAAFQPGAARFLDSPPLTYTTSGSPGVALVQVTCSVPSGGSDFTVYLDDWWFGAGSVALFVSGFETGQEVWTSGP